MQAKVCPKCKVENKPENVTCSGCYASLDGVEVTESQGLAAAPAQPPTPESAAPPAPAPPQQQPPAAQGPPSEQASPYGPAPAGAYGPRPTPQPVRQGSNVGVIILLLLIIGGGAFAGWWFLMKPQPPEQVLQDFFDSAKAGDLEAMKACFTEASIQKMGTMPGKEKGVADDMNRAFGKDGGDWNVKMGEAVYEGDDKAVVSIAPADESERAMVLNMGVDFGFVLLREGGRWKIDMDETEKHIQRQMQKVFQNMPKSLPKVPSGGG